MNFLHIIPNLKKGGAERLVTDIVRELKTRPEIEVRLVIFRDEIEYNVEDLRDVLHIIPSSVQLSLWKKNKLNIYQLQAFIDVFQPDIIHSHLFEAEIVSRSCFYPQAKWFSHGHDNIRALNPNIAKQKGIKEHLVAKYEKNYLIKRYKLNSGTHFIAISKDTEGFFQKYGWGMAVSKIENAIDYKRFYSEKSKPKDKIRIANVGSFQKKKNQQLLIHIGAVLKQRNKDFEIHFFGQGNEIDRCKELVLELNLKECYYFHGNVNNVENQLELCNIYVHTANYEPFGLVLLEAMAAGLPVITLDGKGNRDLIEEGKNGYMINKENPQVFANKIMELWKNQEKYKAMSQYAKQYAKQYDIKPYVAKLLSLYQST
jgi:glycosyltransferase involved in cell wall biosynthesis